MNPRLVSVNTSAEKQFRKVPRSEGRLVTDFGLEGDRHAGRPERQVSILNAETVTELAQAGMPVEPGVLGENITVEGVAVTQLRDGTSIGVCEDVMRVDGDRQG